MRSYALALAIFTALVFLLLPESSNTSHVDEYDAPIFGEYMDYNMGDMFPNPDKKSCVSRGGNCDNRPSDCCYSTICRCNLWGANCRCQRKGLFSFR